MYEAASAVRFGSAIAVGVKLGSRKFGGGDNSVSTGETPTLLYKR